MNAEILSVEIPDPCDNHPEVAAVVTLDDPGANPISLCGPCTPQHLASRVAAGQLKLKPGMGVLAAQIAAQVAASPPLPPPALKAKAK